MVQMSLDRSNVQHEKLVLKLVEPFIEGFSIALDVEMKSAEMKVSYKPNATLNHKSRNKFFGGRLYMLLNLNLNLGIEY